VEDILIRKGGGKVLTLWGTFADGHQENLVNEATFTSTDFTIKDGMIIGSEEKKGVVRASYTDFLGTTHTLDINVEVSDLASNHVLVINNGAAGKEQWDKEAICQLATPMEKGKTYIIRAMMRGDNNGNCALWPRWDASTHRDEWGNSADIQYLATNNVTTSFSEITWRCTAKYPHDVLIFAIGKMGGGNVYLDDVSCIEEGGTTEMITNGNFESDNISNWSILSWAGMSLSVMEDATTGIQYLHTIRNNHAIYSLQGIKVGTADQWSQQPAGTYIVNGKVILKR
jgi:hypothetical protein